ncbi:zinc finger domain-containing protein [Pedobacter sp. GR22-6]|uniref:zinc finger domain-containing protein n=1 Tax=Pedobacter sp. GR22-6 TaxID=3127957 RepID=UPI00307CC8E1
MNDLTRPGTINPSLQCQGCGALLHFAPGTRNLKCDHCGESNAIESSKVQKPIQSVDYDRFVASIDQHKQADHMKVVRCSNCGSETVLSAFTTSDKCSFCTAPLVLSPQDGQQYLPPHYILPFEVNRQQGLDCFQKWLKGLWWAPNDLAKKVSSSSSSLQGIYLPHWTYDTNTVTDYTGQRGDYYYTTESYSETVNGKTETRTRQVRHTRWSSVSGRVNCSFYDLLVPASKSLPQQSLDKLAPWKFELMVDFDERYMSGFRSETYQIDPKEGLLLAIEQTEAEIRSEVSRDIGGDEQVIDDADTEYLDKALKYLMLPVWTSAYNYNNKIYQFTVNASTGEVIGQRPLSAVKIVLCVLLVLALLAAAFFLV